MVCELLLLCTSLMKLPRASESRWVACAIAHMVQMDDLQLVLCSVQQASFLNLVGHESYRLFV